MRSGPPDPRVRADDWPHGSRTDARIDNTGGILVRMPAVRSYEDPEATAPLQRDGRLHTGVIAIVDELPTGRGDEIHRGRL